MVDGSEKHKIKSPYKLIAIQINLIPLLSSEMSFTFPLSHNTETPHLIHTIQELMIFYTHIKEEKLCVFP